MNSNTGLSNIIFLNYCCIWNRSRRSIIKENSLVAIACSNIKIIINNIYSTAGYIPYGYSRACIDA